MSPTRHAALPAGVDVLERGWLSANNILLHGATPDEGAVLIDTSYATHASQTLALVEAALNAGEAPRLILNTHLHSDHCGGNAALASRYGCPIAIPPGDFDAVEAWDESRLSYLATGQHCPRFKADRKLHPGETLEQGGRGWEVHAAPGHDPHSVLLFEPESRSLISADALWERGFGIVFPELDGDCAFDEVERTLDLIQRLAPAVVIPGHGAVFTDLATALATARQKLGYFRKEPSRHALHAAKALTAFHLLEVQRCGRTELIDWLSSTPVLVETWRRFFTPRSLRAWTNELVDDLVKSGVLTTEPGADDAQISLRPPK